MKFSVCLPDQDPDHWMDVEAGDAEHAATKIAEHLCSRDPDWYRSFNAGEALVIREEGACAPELPPGQPGDERFEVTVESVPHFSARRMEVETPETCRRCTECVGEEHHWLTSMPECPEDGEPFIPCKHCDARAALCEECFEAPVWPIVSDQPLCSGCRLEGES